MNYENYHSEVWKKITDFSEILQFFRKMDILSFHVKLEFFIPVNEEHNFDN